MKFYGLLAVLFFALLCGWVTIWWSGDPEAGRSMFVVGIIVGMLVYAVLSIWKVNRIPRIHREEVRKAEQELDEEEAQIICPRRWQPRILREEEEYARRVRDHQEALDRWYRELHSPQVRAEEARQVREDIQQVIDDVAGAKPQPAADPRAVPLEPRKPGDKWYEARDEQKAREYSQKLRDQEIRSRKGRG